MRAGNCPDPCLECHGAAKSPPQIPVKFNSTARTQTREAGMTGDDRMSSTGKPQKRWMASALKTAAQVTPTLPFQRGQRKSMAGRALALRARAA